MKKLFATTLLATLTFAVATATDYTDSLAVTIDYGGTVIECDPDLTTISVDENADGTYSLSLKNFILNLAGDELAIGNINIDNVPALSNAYSTYLATSQTIALEAGDDDSVTWYGPMLTGGEAIIPVTLAGKVLDDSFCATIDIDFSGMAITVTFGSATYQLPNAGFEDFHSVTSGSATSDEPNAWHSFMSATGTWASFVSTSAQTASSDDVRPGSDGTTSVLVTSRAIMGISANGTITTGRLQAGALDATSTDNCSFLDTSVADTDANGDPFYTLLDGQPDSIAVWVKYHVGERSSSNEANVYATASAIITDGSYYQDPEADGETYTNVVAKAVTTAIGAATDSDGNDAWQLITLPFDYDSYVADDAATKAILVTLSTCAVPGGGSTSSSDVDELYVDDISLIYNAKLASLAVAGEAVDGFDKDVLAYDIAVTTDAESITADDIEAVADGVGAYVDVTVEAADDATIATVVVLSCDLATSTTYTLTITTAEDTAIESVTAACESDNASEAIYSLDGRRLQTMGDKGVYIVKKGRNEAVKVVKK